MEKSLFSMRNILRKRFIFRKKSIVQESHLPTAFVLINTEPGSETNVVKDLRKVDGVCEAYAVYGTYDIVATVKAETIEKLKEIIMMQIRRLHDVNATLTLMSSEENEQLQRSLPVG